MLMIWGGTTEQLSDFMEEPNSNNRNIKHTYTSHHETLPVLDLIVGTCGDHIITKTYQKEIAENTLLEATSDHPRSLIQGIPVGQFLRIKRNCTLDKDFSTEAIDMYNQYRERGYSHKCIRQAKKRAHNIDRHKCLDTTPGPKHNEMHSSPIRIINRFEAQWDQVKRILNNH